MKALAPPKEDSSSEDEEEVKIPILFNNFEGFAEDKPEQSESSPIDDAGQAVVVAPP